MTRPKPVMYIVFAVLTAQYNQQGPYYELWQMKPPAWQFLAFPILSFSYFALFTGEP